DPEMLQRARIVSQLDATPGNHLVIVRYSPKHDAHEEWVYNRADIDGSKIVWAREIPGKDMNPLLDYFRERTIWLVERDGVPAKMQPWQGAEDSSASPYAVTL